MNLELFSGPGRPLGVCIVLMLAAALAGTVIGIVLPWRAYRNLREESVDADAFDPSRRLKNFVLMFQAAAATGFLYSIVAAFFLLMWCGAFTLETAAPASLLANPKVFLILGVLGAAAFLGGVLKGVAAGRQVPVLAKTPEKFGLCFFIALLPEALEIAGLLFFMATTLSL